MGLENFSLFFFDMHSIQMTTLPPVNSLSIPAGTSSTAGVAAVLMQPGGSYATTWANPRGTQSQYMNAN